MAIIRVEDLWWRYPAYVGKENPWTLKGLSLNVERGEFLGITGPSGAGKTTLCLTLIGYIPRGYKIPPKVLHEFLKGRIEVFGELVLERRKDEVRLGRVPTEKIGLVMQDPENQFLTMSLLHEVSLGLQIKGYEKDEIEKRVKEALDRVGLGHLYPIADKIHPMDLSGGQKQRAAIASFLALRPDVLILDEPTSDLDPKGKEEVIETIDVLRKEYGLTVILVEHDPHILRRFCDRISLLYDGRIEFTADPLTFYQKVRLLLDKGVAVPNTSLLTWELKVRRFPQTPEEAYKVLMRHIKPEKVENLRFNGGKEKVEKIIEIEDVWFRYEDGTIALRGVSADVRRGDYVALIGPNGSGKTTLSKLLVGIYRPWRGKIRIMGMDASKPDIAKKLPRYVGYVFQNPDHQIFTRTVYDEVAYGPMNLGLNKEEIDKRVKEALSVVGLLEYSKEDPIFLGKGQKQRLAVASILAMKPEILIVDEPTTGQDYRMKKGIMSLMDALHSKGSTIITITHDMELVAEHCRKAIVMNEGKVIFHGPVRRLFDDDKTLEKASLYPPDLVSLSKLFRREFSHFPLLLGIKEWEMAV